jgi:hypothetical protein
MCHSTTRLIYGITIKSWSLYIASLAFEKLIPVSLALDIIMMRYGNRTLEMVKEDCTRRSELPVEIWEMIRKEVIALEIVAAETKELERVRPPRPCGDGEEEEDEYYEEEEEEEEEDKCLKARGEGGKTFYSKNGYWSDSEEVFNEEDELRHLSDERAQVSIASYHSALSGLTEDLYRV